jgi:hypothetical protein
MDKQKYTYEYDLRLGSTFIMRRAPLVAFAFRLVGLKPFLCFFVTVNQYVMILVATLLPIVVLSWSWKSGAGAPLEKIST